MPAASAETSKLLYAAHEDFQDLRDSAQQETDGLNLDQLHRWLPMLVRVHRCADAVERMVVRGRVVPDQGLEAYLEAVKLQAEGPTTLGTLDPDWWKETEEYDRQLLATIVASLRALLPQSEGAPASTSP